MPGHRAILNHRQRADPLFRQQAGGLMHVVFRRTLDDRLFAAFDDAGNGHERLSRSPAHDNATNRPIGKLSRNCWMVALAGLQGAWAQHDPPFPAR